MNGTKDYYGGDANIYEVIKIIEHFGLSFSEGNCLKYLLRAGKKDPSTRLEDLRKGLYYFQRLVDSEAQKDLTINLKCEDNLSPVLEEMHDKVLDIKKEWVCKDREENSKWKEENAPKIIQKLKLGDSIKATKSLIQEFGTEEYITEGKYYTIDKIDNKYACINGGGRCFSLDTLDQYFFVENFNAPIKDQPKLISELKVGDKIKAINLCDNALSNARITIGKFYIIQGTHTETIGIIDDNGYYIEFIYNGLDKFFHVSKE